MDIFSSLLICSSIIYGIIAQILLLDIHINKLAKSKRLFFIVGNLCVVLSNFIISFVLPMGQHMKLYILIVHVPIFLLFWLSTEIAPIKVLFSVFTAIFLIYPANAVVTAISYTINWLPPIIYYFMYLLSCFLILLMISKFFQKNINYLNKNYTSQNFIKLCMLPLAYNISNYWLGMYKFPVASTKEIFYLRILIFVITITAYALILDISKFSREKEELQRAKIDLSLLLESSNHQLNVLQTTQEQALIYRHDMRHHLSLIGGFLVDKDTNGAEEYVKLVERDIDKITPDRYCENNTVNLILSFFASKAKNNKISLFIDANLPQSIATSDTELCALLSNGLENALTAANNVNDEENRIVKLSCFCHKGNLLILIENSFSGKVMIENGLPRRNSESNGLGAKSINMITEKYKGYCSFETKGEIFLLKIVLPL